MMRLYKIYIAIVLYAATNALAGDLHLVLRSQKKAQDIHGQPFWKMVEEAKTISAEQTMLIVTDIWEEKGCRAHVERINEMVPVINQVTAVLRNDGSHIVWAPSDVTDIYKNDQAREKMINAPFCPLPAETSVVEPPLPVGDGTISCDSEGDFGNVERQHPGLVVDQAKDGISSDGQEIWNFINANGIKLVMICGVHTDECILNRPFGIKRMVRWRVPVILLRDLTDASYNPFTPPYVSHEEGTAMVVDYIEKFWCPTVSIKGITGMEPVSFCPWKNTETEDRQQEIARSRGRLYLPPQPKYHISLRSQCKSVDAKILNIWKQQQVLDNIMADRSAILVAGMNKWRRDGQQTSDSLAARINSFSAAARKAGYLIVHAPVKALDQNLNNADQQRLKSPEVDSSSCCAMNGYYFTYLRNWQPAAYERKMSEERYEPPLPIPPTTKVAIETALYQKVIQVDSENDCICYSLAELSRFIQSKKLKNIFVVGQYANDDLFSGPCGIKSIISLGANVAVVRDLLDISNDPFQPPYVNHMRALDIMIGYFEKFWCPTVASEDLLTAN